MGAIVLTVIALTFVALTGGNQNTAQREGPNQPATTGAGLASQSGAPSPGRGNADAPPTGQTNTQR
jgi:hypothetical protein